ncbi:hypothetical protein [Mucilaginibacter sp.]|uniref:hypothetical protein n=1 Tax=Mucilaginibacter sp. TaxID=1882438 RepID=UPI002606A1D5|nr:hypothetical protein [Mucilaginibacter sp.]MDB5032557.1 hypothetical protein [Mucilaginibacter sp.]
MKKATYTLLFLAFFLFIGKASAQDYKSAVGLKFGGYENGISGKVFVDNSIAYEALLGFRQNGIVITGLYEINQEAFNVPALKFYYGFGGHIGSVGQGTYRTFNGNDYTYTHPQLLLGGDATVGLEYLIPASPIAISLDLNPRIELASGPYFDIAPGLGLKYTF